MNDRQILKQARNISHFRGVFIRDTLPKKIRRVECGIINLDTILGTGTDWVAYVKNNNKVKYFDSFGNLQPPLEVIKYFKSEKFHVKITYNRKRYQSFNSTICGKLALQFLYKNAI